MSGRPPGFMEPIEIPVVEFEGLDDLAEAASPDLDLDNLPQDLQALLAKDSMAPGSSHSGSLSIPSDIQSMMLRSRGPSRGTDCGCIDEDSSEHRSVVGLAGAAPAAGLNGTRLSTAPPLGFEWKVDFDVLRRSNTLAAGLPAAVQRSARKIECEAPMVAKLNSRCQSAPASSQATLSAGSRIAALAARVANASFSNASDPNDASTTAAMVNTGLSAQSSPIVRPPCGAPPVIARNEEGLGLQTGGEDDIDLMLKATIQDDDVEQFLSRPNSGLPSEPSQSSCYTFIVHPPRGLVNLGNTCFLNAAVQALGHCTPLTAYLLQGLFVMDLNEANPLGTGCVLTMVFTALLHEIFSLRSASVSSAGTESAQSSAAQSNAAWAGCPASPGLLSASGSQGSGGSAKAFPPLDFLMSVAQFNPFLATGEMHDAQELLAWLLDSLHEDLNRVKKAPAGRAGTGPVVRGQKADREEERFAAEAWHEHLHHNRSVIVDLFQGQLRSQVRCRECGARSLTFDPFQHLTLPVPANADKMRLEDLLELLCRDEELDSNNQWECPGCGHRVKASKKLDLWKLPPLLMVHLKRFEWVQAEGGGPAEFQVRKLECSVSLAQERLDLRPLVAPEAPQKEPLLYDLVAVVDHHGKRTDEGHYTATCRRPDGWCCFDDAYPNFLGEQAQVVGPQNYILFLERRSSATDPRAIAEQRANEPHAWPHVIDVDWSFLTGSEDSKG